MHIVHVYIQVLPESIDAFRAATLENARNSVQEPGVARFDFLQDADDSTRFTLVEAYRSPDDAAKHKATAHYATWNQTVASMMAQPRARQMLVNIFPGDEGWG